MDEKLHRIIQFLRKNNNHYFESSDIAYHLKYDEQYTSDALLYLSHIQLVTQSNGPQGNPVWYAAEHWDQAVTEHIPQPQVLNGSGDVKPHNYDTFHELVEKVERERKPFPLGLFIVSVVFILIIGLLVYLGKRYVDTKFDELTVRVNAAATKSEFATFSEKAMSNDDKLGIKIGELSGKIDSTNSAVDSLYVKDSLIQKQIVDLKQDFRRR